MKKLIALCLCILMALSVFAGCASQSAPAESASSEEAAPAASGSESAASEEAASEEEAAPAASGDKVVKIGVFEPQTGDNGAGGKQEVLGIQYANSVKPSVTINGTEYKIELDIQDNQSSTDKAVSAAQQLVADAYLLPGRSDIQCENRTNLSDIPQLPTDWTKMMEVASDTAAKLNSLCQ